jgi:hypothetical protein
MFDQALAAGIGFNRQGAAARVGAHPLDADGAAARAHVPEQFAGQWRQAGQGHGAHVAFGQLAVVFERRIRQAGEARQARGIGVGQAVDGNQVQIGDRGVRPSVGHAIDTSLSRAAQVFKDAEAARPKAGFNQQRGNRGRALPIIAQHQQAHAAGQMCIQRRQGPGHHR